MEIILLEKVRNLGDLGETVKVANGYARNFLIPQKKAMRATEDAKAAVDERRRQLANEESKRQEVAQARADLAVREVTIARLVAESGHLYGSVLPADIADAMTQAGCRVEKSEVSQPDGPIKQIGQFSVDVIFHPEVRFEVTITVVAEGSAPSAVEAESEVPPAESPPEEQAEEQP